MAHRVMDPSSTAESASSPLLNSQLTFGVGIVEREGDFFEREGEGVDWRRCWAFERESDLRVVGV